VQNKTKTKAAGETNPAGGRKKGREANAEKNKMLDRDRRPEQQGSKMMKGNRRRAG
jgi:hypothetical protein